MDFLRNIRLRLQQLDQLHIIDLKWLQLWLVMLIVAFGAVTYIWDIFVAEDDPTSHFPPSILPTQLRKKLLPHGFTSEREARSFALREIDAAVIACRRNFDVSDESAVDAVTMMKSAAVGSKSTIHFHIFTEDQLYPTFMLKLDEWPPHLRHRVSFKFSHVTYPESLLGWKNLHQPCSSFKLFVPHVLKDLDFAMYIDSDSVFLKPIDQLWTNLLDFNDQTVLSLAASPANPSSLSKYGIKALDTRGVLFDIDRLRHSVLQVPTAITNLSDGRFRFELVNKTWHPNMLHTIYSLFRNEITVPDQDILSILFHFNMDKMKLLPCCWSFRWNHCKYYLKWITSVFLNATMQNWPLLDRPQICSSVGMVHSKAFYISREKREEFFILQQLWRNASYNSLTSDVAREMRNFLASNARSKFIPCYKINMRIFEAGLRLAQDVT